MNKKTQLEKFKATSRKLECDEDPEAFDRLFSEVAPPKRSIMKTYYLEPVIEHRGDPRWEATELKESCWVLARSEEAARRKVELATIAMVDMAESKETLYSPWLDPELTDCAPGNAPVAMKEGIIVSEGGHTHSA